MGKNADHPGEAILKQGQKFVANCADLSDIAKHILKGKDEKAYQDSRIYTFAGGDHIFLMIGTGTNRVLCDVWSGNYCLESELPKYLFNYNGYWSFALNKAIDIAVPFDPTFHQLVPAYKSVVPVKVATVAKNGAATANDPAGLAIAMPGILNDGLFQANASAANSTEQNVKKSFCTIL